MSNISLEEMLQSAVHFGHKTSKWNPKISPYLFGEHNGVHIFDLIKTAECLEKAMEFTRNTIANGKTILVVSTKPQIIDLISAECEKQELSYVTHKWFAGLLTNFKTIKARIRYLKKIKEQMATGEIERYTKKEQVKIRKEMTKLQNALGGVENMEKMPAAVFVTDTIRDHTAIVEARKIGIPVIAICDSMSNPTEVDYPIPGNDDAMKSLKFLTGKFFEAIEKGKKSPAPKKEEVK